MKFSQHYTVNWHDTDANRFMRPARLLMYMQETANRQFARQGRSLDDLRDREGLAFILSRIALEIKAPIAAHEEIEVQTFTCAPHGPIFPRGFRVLRDGEEVASAMSQWALLRLCDRAFVRADAFDPGFGDEPVLSLSQPLRLSLPRDLCFEQVGEREIVWSDVDYNLHMNNTKYPDMVCDFLPSPATERACGMSLSYCREARLGDRLTVERAFDGVGTYYFRTKRGEQVCLEASVRVQPI